VSSDTDAPGPFVGSYPFRRSTKGLLQANLDSNSKQDRFTSSMSKNYGELSSAFQMPKEFLSASNRIKDLVLEAAEKANIDVSKSNILDVGCGQGGRFSVTCHFFSLFLSLSLSRSLSLSLSLSLSPFMLYI
jgi:hypothetical protein